MLMSWRFVVPEECDLLRVVEELHQPRVILVEGRQRDGRADAARHDRLGVRVLAAEDDVGLARDAGHAERLEVELPFQRVEVGHDRADRGVAVDVAVVARGALRQLPELGVGVLHRHLRVVRPGEEEEVQRVIIEEFGG